MKTIEEEFPMEGNAEEEDKNAPEYNLPPRPRRKK